MLPESDFLVLLFLQIVLILASEKPLLYVNRLEEHSQLISWRGKCQILLIGKEGFYSLRNFSILVPQLVIF